METTTVVKKLFVLGMISVVLNSMFLLIFTGCYITVLIIYGVSSSYYVPYYPSNTDSGYLLQTRFSMFAAIFESIVFISSFLSSLLILIGSCLGMMEKERLRTVSQNLSKVAVLILLFNIVVNTIITSLSFVAIVPGVINSSYLIICGSILVGVLVFQLIMLLYGIVFMCVVRKSLRH